jgi:hypothetical protein
MCVHYFTILSSHSPLLTVNVCSSSRCIAMVVCKRKIELHGISTYFGSARERCTITEWCIQFFFIGTRQSKRALQASVISIRAARRRPPNVRDSLTIDSRDSRRRAPGKTEFLVGGGACWCARSLARSLARSPRCANEIVKQSQGGWLAGSILAR